MRKLILGLVLGVILLGTAGAGSAWALPAPFAWCDGQPRDAEAGWVECRTGQEVKAVTRQNLLDPNDTPVPADWDPHYENDTFQPEQFDTTTFRYVYTVPGTYVVHFRTDDGRQGRMVVQITDSAILTQEPAFQFTPVHPRRPNGGDQYETRLFRGGEHRGKCMVERSVGYYAYRDHTYRAGIVIRYRFVKRKRVRGSKRVRRVVRKGRLGADRDPGTTYTASQDHRFAGVGVLFAARGSKEARRRFRRFERLGTRFVVILRERIVAADGSTLYYTKRRNWLDPTSCSFIDKPRRRVQKKRTRRKQSMATTRSPNR
ncbi:MAG: hypothetical protein WED32_03840 [Patescibacteria group bacterium]